MEKKGEPDLASAGGGNSKSATATAAAAAAGSTETVTSAESALLVGPDYEATVKSIVDMGYPRDKVITRKADKPCVCVFFYFF